MKIKWPFVSRAAYENERFIVASLTRRLENEREANDDLYIRLERLCEDLQSAYRKDNPFVWVECTAGDRAFLMNQTTGAFLPLESHDYPLTPKRSVLMPPDGRVH